MSNKRISKTSSPRKKKKKITQTISKGKELPNFKDVYKPRKNIEYDFERCCIYDTQKILTKDEIAQIPETKQIKNKYGGIDVFELMKNSYGVPFYFTKPNIETALRFAKAFGDYTARRYSIGQSRYVIYRFKLNPNTLF